MVAATIPDLPAGCFRGPRSLWTWHCGLQYHGAARSRRLPRPGDLPDEFGQKKFLTPSEGLVIILPLTYTVKAVSYTLARIIPWRQGSERPVARRRLGHGRE